MNSNPISVNVKAAPAAQLGGRLLQLSDTPNAGPTWISSSRVFATLWENQGGDWVDRDGVNQGTNHYATVTCLNSGIGPAPDYAPKAYELDVTDAARVLQKENSGFYLGGSYASYIASAWLFDSAGNPLPNGNWEPETLEDRAPSPLGPKLRVITDKGTFDCPCVAAGEINPGLNYCNSGAPRIPVLIKFDMTKISGVISKATFTFCHTWYDGHLWLNILRLPRLVTDPAKEIGGVQFGIANEVENDAGLANHPDVWDYADLSSAPAIYEKFSATDPLASCGATFEKDPRYGFTWLHCWGCPADETGASQRNVAWHKICQPKVPNDTRSWVRDFEIGKALGHDEMWCRFMFRIGADLREAFNEAGMKLPGMAGTYNWGGTDGIRGGGWECRMWHSTVSNAHPHLYRASTYYFGAEVPGNPGGGGAQGLYFNQANFCFEAERDYCVEQHVKLNTVYPDGINKTVIEAEIVADQYVVKLLSTAGLESSFLVAGQGMSSDPLTFIQSVDSPTQITLTTWARGVTGKVPLTFTKLGERDGIYQIEIDGVLMDDRRDVFFRRYPEVQIQDLPFVNIYHGGMQSPKGWYHDSLASFVIAKRRIGPPKRIA